MPYLDPERRRACNRRAAERFRRSEKGKAARREYEREKRRTSILARPFVGVDGEGAGVDRLGRQSYLLLRAGDRVLWRAGERLRSEECLTFLADLPSGPLYVGYYFGYDVTQILRDLPPERLRRILNRGGMRAAGVEWRGFEIAYLPSKHLRVRRAGAEHWVTISDVGSFFQCSFVKALETWGIGTPEVRAEIQAGKERRGADTLTPRDLEYNALECEYLAELMTKFREVTDEADCRPAQYEGPGYIASSLLGRHGIPRRKDRPPPPPFFHDHAVAAYYGGRFELFQFGEIGDSYSYDINSAYPAAMLDLPCLLHGRWERVRGRDLTRLWSDLAHGAGDNDRASGPGPYLAHVRFHKPDQYVCDLPIRTKEHRIVWPRRGSGWYWSVELEAAVSAGTRILSIDDAWTYKVACECDPFSWLPEMYAERKRLGKSGKGLVLKLGINSLYGKTAQSVGSAPYATPVWAGLITSQTRATIIRAYSRIPGDGLTMIATDGIFTRVPIPGFENSAELGAWEAGTVKDLLTVQPGCYFKGTDGVRSRGVNRSTFGPHKERFRAKIRQTLRGRASLGSLDIPVNTFVGLKLALHLGKPELAGRWQKVPRKIAFDHTTKRADHWTRAKTGGYAQTYTQEGGTESVPYDRHFGEHSDLAMDRMVRDEQPDYVARLPEE